jgi:hypothetical protein
MSVLSFGVGFGCHETSSREMLLRLVIDMVDTIIALVLAGIFIVKFDLLMLHAVLLSCNNGKYKTGVRQLWHCMVFAS